MEDTTRLWRATRAFTTRRVPESALAGLAHRGLAPRAGDLVLARVESIGHHTRLHRPDGHRKHLFPGDEILVAYGNRYAPRQFEAIVPGRVEPCHLVAAGGVAARVVSSHARILRAPTAIAPVGLVADRWGRPVNLADWGLPARSGVQGRSVPTLAVLGSAMDAGKSTAAAYLARGLACSGLRVGFAKVTGTGAGGDVWLLHDAGAAPVVDFTDAGFASTYRLAQDDVERILATLVGHLREAGVDAILIEVADGLLQPETAQLLRSRAFRDLVDGVIFAAPDSLSAAGGVQILGGEGLRVVAVGGRLTAAPLLKQETVAATGLPVMGRAELADPVTARKLLDQARG